MNGENDVRLADTFLLLADTLTEDFDPVEVFQTLCERCAELLEVPAVGLLLARPVDERLQPCAWAPATARMADLLAQATTHSPAAQCQATAQALPAVALDSSSARWPDFADQARRDGYTFASALPLRLREQTLGCLLLLGTGTRPLPDVRVRLAQSLADAAAIGLVHQRTLTPGNTAVSQLRTTLHSRILIEQAMGYLGARLEVTPDAAFDLMRRHARSRRRPLTEVARHVVEEDLLPEPPSSFESQPAGPLQ